MLGFVLLTITLILFLIIMLSPLETLSWFAGWNRLDSPGRAREAFFEVQADASQQAPAGIDQYVIFMTGVGGYARDSFLPEERLFMDNLIEAMPSVRLVDDVYPYVSTERDLGEGSRFDRYWRYAINQKMQRRIVGFTINLRNLMQVLVSADPRYGQIYSRGVSNILLHALERHNYPFGSGMPVTLIGYSGGGEMSISAVGVLRRALQAPIRVISLGGVMGNDPAIADADHFYHVYGKKDMVQIIGPILFPGRWRIAIFSAWSKARRDGTITYVHMGDIKHNGPGGYLDQERFLPDDRSYFDYTVDTISELILAYPDIIPEDKIGAPALQGTSTPADE